MWRQERAQTQLMGGMGIDPREQALSRKIHLVSEPYGLFFLLEGWASGRRAPPTVRLGDEGIAVAFVYVGPTPT